MGGGCDISLGASPDFVSRVSPDGTAILLPGTEHVSVPLKYLTSLQPTLDLTICNCMLSGRSPFPILDIVLLISFRFFCFFFFDVIPLFHYVFMSCFCFQIQNFAKFQVFNLFAVDFLYI